MSDEEIYIIKQLPLIEKCLDIIKAALRQETLNPAEIAGVGAFLQNTYSGVEGILRCQVVERGIAFSKDFDWHKQLLNSALANALITREEFAHFDEPKIPASARPWVCTSVRRPEAARNCRTD